MLLAFIGFILGVAVQLQQAALFPWWVYAPIMLVAVVFITQAAIKSVAYDVFPKRRMVLLGMACVGLGFSLTGLRALHYQTQTLANALEGADIEVVGMVSAMPQATPQGTRFRFSVEGASLNGRAVELPSRLQLGWYPGPERTATREGGGEGDALALNRQPQALRAGERWRMTVRLKAPHGNLNPHGFDYELWLWEQGVGASGYVRATPANKAPQKLIRTWQHPIDQLRQDLRERIFERVGDARLAGVVAALAVGDQAAIERADWDVFRATGVAHLVSISGLHITMFAWAAMQLVGALWRRSALWGWRLCLLVPAPTAARLGGLALALAYALFSGFAVPAQRTVWMLLAVTALRLAGLRWHWSRVWALACAVVVLADPWALLSAGFWLSFVAVGVLFASDRQDQSAINNVASNADNTPAKGLFGLKILPMTFSLLREQSVLTLALAPLSLVLFGQVSLVGWLANLLAIPWVTLVVTPLALGGALWPALWAWAASAVQLMGQGLQVMAAWPWATLSVAAAPWPLAAAAIAGGILSVLRLPWALRASGATLLLSLLLWQPQRPAPGSFEVLAADVGQGTATLVRTATHSLLYDAGPRFSRESDAGHRTLVPLLRALGERLDTVVLSHRDSDHTGGALAVLQMQPQAALLSSIEATHELQALRPAQPCMAGQRWQWDGVQFEVLHPQVADYATAQKPNTLSCVLRVSVGPHAVLLTGDIEAAQEARLVLQGAPLKANLLLVPHHGSKTSSTAAFVQAVQPQFALVQSGYRNRFGHPVPEVLARWQSGGAQVLDSPHCGAALWRSAQPQVVECQRQLAPRYWHHAFD